MELRQLRSFMAVCDADFNVSRAAEQVNLVQPAVSQHLKLLEEELGVHLFLRHGKRLTGLTEAGEGVALHARSLLSALANIVAVGEDFQEDQAGVLRIGATHTQARYVLPPIIRQFSDVFPHIEVQIHQGNPQQLVAMAVNDVVDLSICTEALDRHPDLSVVDSYRWNRCLIALPDHPILDQRELSLEAIASYPLITYVFGFSGRGHLNAVFEQAGLKPRVALSAADTDVIKTYVRERLGVGIIADLAFDEEEDQDLVRKDVSHLFPWETTKIAYQKNKYLKKYESGFIEFFQKEVKNL